METSPFVEDKENLPAYVIVDVLASPVAILHAFNCGIMSMVSYFFVMLFHLKTKRCYTEQMEAFTETTKKLQREMTKLVVVQVGSSKYYAIVHSMWPCGV